MEVVKLSPEFMEEFYKEHPEFKGAIENSKDMWCECEQETDDFQFHDDNEGRGEYCVQKHHWHCGLCGKLNQIG